MSGLLPHPHRPAHPAVLRGAGVRLLFRIAGDPQAWIHVFPSKAWHWASQRKVTSLLT